jgi:hypothetical protein
MTLPNKALQASPPPLLPASPVVPDIHMAINNRVRTLGKQVLLRLQQFSPFLADLVSMFV